MERLIYLRPLSIADATISYLWRADHELWKYTEFKANSTTTQAIEAEWLQRKLLNENDARFAICLKQNDTYIGNVQLIDVENHTAELYIFIGDKNYWSKGIGKSATKLILQYGFGYLHLEHVFLHVSQDNLAAVSIFSGYGFSTLSQTDGLLKMQLDIADFSANDPSPEKQ